MTNTNKEALEHCEKLAAHLRLLDSGSKDADAIENVIKQALSGNLSGGWMDIETAPKDGTDIILLYRFEPDEKTKYSHKYSVVGSYWMEEDVDVHEGWFDIDPHDVLYGWMPLPTPPTIDEE